MRESYNTEQRSQLVGFLRENKHRHFTVDAIIYELKNKGILLPKSTIYRQINKLVASGAVRRFEDENSRNFVYQYADQKHDCDSHFHLKCKKCGRLIHIHCDYLSEAKEHIAESHGFIIGSERAVIYGVCRGCEE